MKSWQIESEQESYKKAKEEQIKLSNAKVMEDIKDFCSLGIIDYSKKYPWTIVWMAILGIISFVTFVLVFGF